MATKRHLSLLLLRQRAVIIVILLILLLQAEMEQQGRGGIAEAAQQEEVQHPRPAMTLPGCQDKCGNVSIPFPFGIKPDCFLEAGFQVICDESSDTGPRAFLYYNDDGMGSHKYVYDAFYSPGMSDVTPKRIVPQEGVELVDISIADSVVRVYGVVASDCTTDGLNHSLKLQQTYLKDTFLLSPTRNVLIGVGWRVTARVAMDVLSMKDPDSRIISCLSDLTDINLWYAVDGEPCPGPGCCKTDLPGDKIFTMFGVEFKLENNPMNKTNPCSYGMVVDRSWYNFSREDIFGYEVLPNKFPRGVPMVLDFAIRNFGYCPTEEDIRAQPNQRYACISNNSYCINSTLLGYTCNCSQHYHGNPYIQNGCIDIDECEFQKKNPELNYYPCSSDGVCKNRLEGYDCPCKRGMEGDGIKGTCKQIFPIATKVTVGRNSHKMWIVAIAALLLSILLCFVFSFVWMRRRRKGRANLQDQPVLNARKEKEALVWRLEEKSSEFTLFEFSELVDATTNFSEQNRLGQGGFGPVYKGQLPDGFEIAVKRLASHSGQGFIEFKNEVELIAKLQHNNLVRLLGCCIQGEEKILVYEYLSNKSLDFFIFDGKKKTLLDWNIRRAIIEGIAQGLLYLHKHSRLRVIHRDLKASNILLDKDMNPKISDFGLAKICSSNDTQGSTRRVVGTYGYMSPEYASEGIYSIKSDVFSFGVLLLEILSGKRNSGAQQYGDFLNLLGYSWELWEGGRWPELLEASIVEEILGADARKYINIALMCVQESADDRPTMSGVVAMLNMEPDVLPNPNHPAYFNLRVSREEESSAYESAAVVEPCSINGVSITLEPDGR